MPTESPTKPVDNPIAKVNDEVAVGADLDFQRRWWRFENIIWLFFTAILVLDVAGAFGRGPVGKGKLRTSDSTVEVTYDRIARYSTPSTLTVKLGPEAVHQGKAQLCVSDSILKDFGNQQVLPEPESAALDHNGILYTFGAATIPDSVEFSLQPRKPGLYRFALRMAGEEQLTAKVLVMP